MPVTRRRPLLLRRNSIPTFESPLYLSLCLRAQDTCTLHLLGSTSAMSSLIAFPLAVSKLLHAWLHLISAL